MSGYDMMNKVERQNFSKKERLCKTKLIDELFERGNVFYTSRFRVVWSLNPTFLPFPAQVAISIPKKIIRLAVSRNLLKRRIRESYRKMKQQLYNFLISENIQVAIVLIYRNSALSDYQTIEKSVAEVLEKLCFNIKEKLKKC
jgi:ribonuclease P protein component